MKEIRLFHNTKPLWWHTDNELIAFKKKYFCFLNPETKKIKKIAILPNLTILLKLLMNFRIFRRIFRLEPSCFTQINDSDYLFCFNKGIYCLDLNNKVIKQECLFRKGLKRTLCICSNGENTFFGEYWTSHNSFGDVKIFQRLNGKWECCYTFAQNQIRHIHKLLINNNDLYCFTGDEISETKIIKFTGFDFSNPEIVHHNSQIYRSCCAVALGKKICYTTDTPYENNKIVLMDTINFDIKVIDDVKSSSIFSSNIFDNSFYFSTVVEPNLLKENGENKRIKIDLELGGIHSKYAELYKVNLTNESLSFVYRLKKDLLPFVFGLGTFIPVVNNSRRFLAFYSSCLRKDGSTIIIPLTTQNNFD